MKKIIISFLLLLPIFALGESLDNPYKVTADVVREGDTFLISANYQSPLTVCQAYQYLTDYEAATKVPGVIESKAFRQANGRVLVERSAEEQIMFIKIKLHTLIEYTEYPLVGTEFTQIKGDSKKFTGKWSVAPSMNGSSSTTIKYQGVLEPDSHVPMFILQYFIQNSLEDRFKVMARLSAERKGYALAACK
jgi:hypothetical protein